MQYDLVIRGGTVVDGTGGEPRVADVAINGNEIAAVGAVDGQGKEEIDASGHLVTPGFIDLHTHMDAQIGWDPMLTPLTWHGVTTVLLGNCGVTFAPCKPADRTFLAEMMETVEDIPRSAILECLPWDWEDYGGYLDSIEKLQPAVNVAGLVGHCAVRYYVMGERAIGEKATEEEMTQIAKVVADSVAAGAAGFSTSRFMQHYLPDGRHVPGTHADHEELVRVAAAVKEAGGGLMQNILKLPDDFEGEMKLLRREAEASGGRVLFSIAAGHEPQMGKQMAAVLDQLCADGADISALAIPRSSGFVACVAGFLPWRSGPWKALRPMDLPGRLEVMRDPVRRAALVEAAKEKGAAIISSKGIMWLGDGETANYENDPTMSLYALAKAAGEHPAETFIRMGLETEGAAMFLMKFFNVNLESLRGLLESERCLPGLGDAGAHVGQVMDAGWATFTLTHWVRDEGLFSVQEGVRRLTSAQARILGVTDRGTLAPGMRADVNVIDLDNLGERLPQYVYDLPDNAGRYIQRGRGYKATVCNGQVILRDDEATGARAGQVLRQFAP